MTTTGIFGARLNILILNRHRTHEALCFEGCGVTERIRCIHGYKTGLLSPSRHRRRRGRNARNTALRCWLLCGRPFYRGSWCPYCCAQLGAFSRAAERLAAAGVTIVALSVDDEATSKALVDKLRLSFPVGFGANVHNIAALTGAYIDDGYLQSTGFVLDQRGRILTAVYSSGAIGRLVPDDVAGFVKYVADHHDARQEAAPQTR